MQKLKKIFLLIPVMTALMPVMAFAALTTLQGTIDEIKGIINSLIPMFAGLAVVIFLWGVVKYITAAGDPEKLKSAKGYLIYGLVGLFVFIAMWGIINFVAGLIGVTPGGAGTVPTLPTF